MPNPQQPPGDDRVTPPNASYGTQQARAGQDAGMSAHYGEEDVDRSREKNKFGTWALVLGLISIFALVLPVILVMTVGVAVCLAAIVLGIMGIRAAGAGLATNRSHAVAGLVLGGIASLFYILAIVGLFLVLSGAQLPGV